MSSFVKNNELVVVLDFGAQYSQLIARRVRECNVYCEIKPHHISLEDLKALNPKGIIFTGGPASVYAEKAPKCDPGIFELGIPILGICYGMQLMAHLLKGDVQRADKREYGKTEIDIYDHEDIFKGFDAKSVCWMSHGDFVASAPEGFVSIAGTANTPLGAICHKQKKLYGVQFHPEVVHTQRGKEILDNFLKVVCGCRGDWKMDSFVEEAVKQIKEKVGDRKVICGLSGGVDSAVAAVLVHRAIGDQLTCIFVNHGLLRKNEAEQVLETFGGEFGIKLVYAQVAERFLSKIDGVSDPEVKRKAIGNEFIRVFETEASKLGDAAFLVQGTLYPDVIESGTGHAALIKTHHNVGGLPEDMAFELIEPLRDLFKDEVRLVGKELGLPDDIVWRHPFPGPGLAIRIMGEVTEEKLEILREADAIFLDELKKAGLYREIWQAFVVLTSTRSVGVMGDERTYAYAVAVRAVTSDDAMTADWARIPYDLLESVSSRIINEVKGVNRVVYDITSKPPGTIEWE